MLWYPIYNSETDSVLRNSPCLCLTLHCFCVNKDYHLHHLQKKTKVLIVLRKATAES